MKRKITADSSDSSYDEVEKPVKKKQCLRNNILNLCKRNSDILFYAIKDNDIELVKMFLNANIFDINKIQNRDYISPFCYAIHIENLKMAKLLLDYGADINDGDKTPEGYFKQGNVFRCWNRTPLLLSCQKYNPNLHVIKFLLENKCAVQNLAFKIAIDTSAEMVELFLENGTDPNMIVYKKHCKWGGEFEDHDMVYSALYYTDSREVNNHEDKWRKRDILVLLALFGGNLIYYSGKCFEENYKIHPECKVMDDVKYILEQKKRWLNDRTHFCEKNILGHLPQNLRKNVLDHIPLPSNLELIRGILGKY